MTKERSRSREPMKKAVMTLKEKRAAKKAKKDTQSPFLVTDKK